MAKVEEYRDYAAECLDSARNVTGAKAKLELLFVANGYLRLADLAEGSAGKAETAAGLDDRESPRFAFSGRDD